MPGVLQPRTLTRREALAAIAASVAALGARPAAAQDADDTGVGAAFDAFAIDGRSPALALVPRDAPGPHAVLVALHGMLDGTFQSDPILLYARRYDVTGAAARLSRLPVTPTPGRPELTPRRAREITAGLAERPFRPFAILCPNTPNVFRARSREAALEAFAADVVDQLLPALRARASVRDDAAGVAIGGVSLGGFLATELFHRRADRIGGATFVQPAIPAKSGGWYGAKIAAAVQAAGPRAIQVHTTWGDVGYDEAVAMSSVLRARGVPHELRTSPGAHDVRFFREAGVLEMLYFAHRAFGDWKPEPLSSSLGVR